MRVILIATLAALVLSIGAAMILRTGQEDSWQAYSTSSTRVGNPGHNLVGQNWSGEPGGGGTAAEGGETPG